MYEIPKKVKIGGMTYKVNITPHMSAHDGRVGEISYQDACINILPGHRPYMYLTLLHEVFHALYMHLGHTDHDEKEIEQLAAAFYALVVDNPKLFERVKP